MNWHINWSDDLMTVWFTRAVAESAVGEASSDHFSHLMESQVMGAEKNQLIDSSEIIAKLWTSSTLLNLVNITNQIKGETN